jgi:hypothetical protein
MDYMKNDVHADSALSKRHEDIAPLSYVCSFPGKHIILLVSPLECRFMVEELAELDMCLG